MLTEFRGLGDEFSAGDVLLEIETDKAQMDVEAQDDGIMAKIMVYLSFLNPSATLRLLKKLLPQVKAGSKAVQVGTRIGVLAEQGDDISSLEIPNEDSAGPGPKSVDTSSSKKDTTSPPPEDRPTKVESSSKSTPETSRKHAAPKTPHTPSPSVAHLLRAHGITKDDVSQIAVTGPKGRLLKGDVLAYLGRIDKSWPKELESRIEKGEKLDLSNIKIAAPKKGAEPKKAVEQKVEVPRDSELKLEVSFSEVLKVQSKLQGMSAQIPLHLPFCILNQRIIDICKNSNPRCPPPPFILHSQSYHKSQPEPPCISPLSHCL